MFVEKSWMWGLRWGRLSRVNRSGCTLTKPMTVQYFVIFTRSRVNLDALDGSRTRSMVQRSTFTGTRPFRIHFILFSNDG